MALIETSMIVGAIVEMVVDAGWDKARKHQVVQQLLRKLGKDFEPTSATFDDIYMLVPLPI